MNSSIPDGSAASVRVGRMCQPGLTSRIASRTAEIASPSKLFPLHWRGSLALGSSARRPMPHTGSRWLASSKYLLAARATPHCLRSIQEKGKTRRCQPVGSHVGTSRNTKPRQFGPVMSSSGNTRPRDHDASPNSRFLASCHLRSL